MSTLLRRAAATTVAIALACFGPAGPASAAAPTAGNVGPVSVSPVHATVIDLSEAVTGDVPLTYSVVDPPAKGSIAFDGSQASFTPAAGPPSGSDFFTYQVTDGTDTSNTAVVALTFNHVPTAQDAGPFRVSPVHATQIGLSGSAADGDHDALTYSLASAPAHGTVVFAGSTATFTPSGSPTGTDTFSYAVSDGIDTSATRTVSVRFNNVPSAGNVGPLTVSPVQTTKIPLGGSVQDDDDDPLSYAVVHQPAHGSVNFAGAVATFVPNGTATGGDSFTYEVSDGIDTDDATVSLTYNHVPSAAGDGPVKISPVNESTINLSSKAVDPDPDDTLTFSVSTPAGKGIASFNGSVAHYLPAVGATGTDSFGYRVSDGIDTSAQATVDLRFNQVPTASNDGSAATPIKVAAKATSSIELASSASDADHDPLTYAVVSQPAHGAVNFVGTVAKLTPTGTPTGSDSFTFQVSDGTDTSSPATVTVVYNAVPQLQNKSLTVSGINPTDINLAPLASDPNGDALTFTPGQPAHGTVTKVGASTAHFTPTGGFSGAEPFTYTVSDGFDTSTATINLRVNDVPEGVGPNGTVSVPFNSAGKAIPLGVTDSDAGDSHTFTVVGTPAKGSVQISGSTATYTPDRGAAGPDSFSFTVSDGIDTSPALTVDVNISQEPDAAPAASPGSALVAFDGQTSVVLRATDPDGDALKYSVKQPKHGTVSSGKSANRTYTADKGYVGTDSFTFTATDPDGKSDSAKVTVTVSKAATSVQSVMFAPAHPTPGKGVTAQVALATRGSVRGGKLTMWQGSHVHRTTMSGKTATVHLGRLAAGKHTFQIRYDGTKTTASVWTEALPVKVARAASSLRVSSTPKQLTTKDRGVAAVHVSAGGAPVDGALVTIAERGKTLGSAVVRGSVAKITLPKFTLGQHNLTVSYAGDADVTSATKTWTLRVALG